MDHVIDRIIDWLKVNGTNTLDGTSIYYDCKDFIVVWHDSSTYGELTIEYHFIENGIECCQPLCLIRNKEMENSSTTPDNWMLDPHGDKQHVMDCLSVFYNLYMANRPAQVE